MLKQILAGYAEVLNGVFRFLLLLGACIAVGAAFVYPLWLLASQKPQVYTIACAIFFAGVLLFLVYRGVAKALKKDKKRCILGIFRLLTILGGILLTIHFVLSWQRLFALIVLGITLVLYGFLAFGMGTQKSTVPGNE